LTNKEKNKMHKMQGRLAPEDTGELELGRNTLP